MTEADTSLTAGDYAAQAQRHAEAGEFEKAGAAYFESLRLAPNSVDAAIGLAYAAYRTGNLDGAVRVLETALQYSPGQSRLLNALGIVLEQAGQPGRSVVVLQQALARDPRDIEIACNLGDVLCRVGHFAEAFAAYRQAAHIRPDGESYLRLAAILEKQEFTAADGQSLDAGLFADLLRILDLRAVDPRFVSRAVASALRHHPAIAACLVETGVGTQDAGYPEVSARLSRIPLLLRLLELGVVPDLDLERLLATLRRSLLRADERDGTAGLGFAAALALQCFANEYLYPETPEETAAVDRLADTLRATLAAGAAIAPLRVLALACYRPLHGVDGAAQLLDRQFPDAVRAVLVRQIAEPLEERRLKQTIPRLTAIDDAVSVMVREQYEENPFPRWTAIPLPAAPRTLREEIIGWCPHLDPAALNCPEKPDILIAGCGTGRQSIYAAAGIRHGSVLAIDLSLSSLAYAQRKSRDYGLRDIEYGQADLLRVAELGRTFDYIESGGVLHHLGDPLAGMRALIAVLRPGGLMRLSFYSRSERAGWFGKIRAALAAKGLALPQQPEEIRRARQEIVAASAGPAADPDLNKIRNFAYFYTLSECRDMLFHVQEHQFDVAGIERALAACGLDFLGFEESLNVEVMAAFRRLHPDPTAMASLALWRDFDEKYPNTLQYRFICRKA